MKDTVHFKRIIFTVKKTVYKNRKNIKRYTIKWKKIKRHARNMSDESLNNYHMKSSGTSLRNLHK